MKIAFIYLVHDDPELTARVAKRLIQHRNFDVFIHVDRKVDIDAFKEKLLGSPRVQLIVERKEIHWAGYSQVEATISTIRQALESKDYDRLVILQGGSYPVWPNSRIAAYYENLSGVQELRMSEPDLAVFNDVHKYRFNWYMDATSGTRKFQNLFTRFLFRARLPFWRKPVQAPSTRGPLPIREAWAQVSITGECARELLEFHQNESAYNDYFAKTYAPDESYIPTFIAGSKYSAQTVEGGRIRRARNSTDMLNTTYFEYPNTIRVFTDPLDLIFLLDRRQPFLRKVDSRRSLELLDLIDLKTESSLGDF